MKVLKFGGTSVGTIRSMSNVREILRRLKGSDAIVVVSALGGLTDNLISIAEKAQRGDDSYKRDMEGVRARHREMIEAMVEPMSKADVSERVESLLDELGNIYDGVRLISSLSDDSLALIVSFGERMSSVIVSRILPELQYADSLEMIRTERWFSKNIADVALTNELIHRRFGKKPKGITVMGGFISRDRDSGVITNLGRGGSDYTAALIAAALDAEILEIWTDVDGFMSADPRIIPGAIVRDHMTFVESMELCTYGAKVIYPPTIYPVFHKNIPIKILNTFSPEHPGTLIDDTVQAGRRSAIRGISSLKGVSLISVSGATSDNVSEINSRTYNSMTKNGVSLVMATTPSEHSEFRFVLSGAEMERGVKILEEEFGPELSSRTALRYEVRGDLSVVAVVGENIKDESGLAPRIENTLQREGIEVYANNFGSSTTTICMCIDSENVDKAMRLIHDGFVE